MGVKVRKLLKLLITNPDLIFIPGVIPAIIRILFLPSSRSRFDTIANS